MQKTHQLNGFDFTHDRRSFDGVWVFYWYFRPTEKTEWCPFSLPTGKTRKADMEAFLRNSGAASDHYEKWIERASDVEAAERELHSALEHLKRVSDPEWGGNGNNPNKDVRIVRQAHSDVDSAKRALESAKARKKRLTE